MNLKEFYEIYITGYKSCAHWVRAMLEDVYVVTNTMSWGSYNSNVNDGGDPYYYYSYHNGEYDEEREDEYEERANEFEDYIKQFLKPVHLNIFMGV